jgi:hypothetical protein
MTSFLHGQDLLGDEILKNFSAIQALSTFSNNYRMQDNQLARFIQKHSTFKTSNNRGLTKHDGLIHHGLKEYELCENSSLRELILNYDSEILGAVFTVQKLTFNNIRLTTRHVLGRFNDSCVKIKNSDEYGVIEYFIINKEKAYSILRRIKPTNFHFNEIIHSKQEQRNVANKLDSHKFIGTYSDELFVEKIDNLHKVFVMDSCNRDICIISTLQTGHLFN